MNSKKVGIRIIVSALAALVLMLGTAGIGAASPSPVSEAKAGGVRTGIHPETGMLAFVGAEPSAPIGVAGAVGEGIPAQTRASAILQAYAPQFGVANPAEELTVLREKESDGRQVIRYQQVYRGIPVLGGELILNMNDGGLVSMSGEVSPFLSISTEPVISAGQARETALALVAKHYNVNASQLTVSEPALWIYDQRLVAGISVLSPHIVWRVEVSAAGLPVRELVLVNARKGNISLNFNQIDTAWVTGTGNGSGMSEMSAAPVSVQPVPPYVLGIPSLSTYNLGGAEPDPISGGSLLCSNNARICGSGDSDANNAHAFAYDTYMAYSNVHSRDSIDNAGMTLKSYVHYGVGYQNAFWDGAEMVYGDGFSAADDVVGHELTDGVTEREASLFYFWESGAINESFSDVWGEYVDQIVNATGGDTALVKWRMGEDIPGYPNGFRDMETPTTFGDPDSMTSIYYCESGNCYNYDNGGVHYNSGVNNKAAYLMVDGGTFNLKTVTPLGWTKTLTIYYEAQTNLLASGAGYYDLYHALYQACVNKVGTAGISLADCQEVRDATDATRMNQEPAANYNPNTGVCPTGTSQYLTVFDEDFETTTNGWTIGGVNNQWTLWSDSLWDFYGWGPYAHDGIDSLYGDDVANYTNEWAISPSIALGAGTKPYLYFAHAYGFEYAGASYYDGGVLEYSTNGGASWTNMSTLYSGGQDMKGTIGSSYGNPLGGKKGFVGDSHGYVESRYNLTSLAGQNVQFRWSLGTDNVNAYWGWVFDDIQVNTCVGIPSVPTLSSPALNALLTDYSPTLNWNDSTGDVASYDYEVATDSGFTNVVRSGNSAVSQVDVSPDLPSNTKYYWRIRSVNAAGGFSAWTASRYFRTALLAPDTASPGVVFPGPEEQLFTRRPTFIWDTVAGVTGYTVEVSTSSAFTTKAINVTKTATSYTHTTDLTANTSYYWRVKANGTNGPSAYSQVRMFRTANPPSAPTLSAPINNGLVTTTTPLLDWSNSTVPAGTTFLYYNVQIAYDNTFTALFWDANVGNFSVTSSSINTPVIVNVGRTYYWRVRAFNTANEYSGWSAVRSFRLPYPAPVLTLPLDAATGVIRKPTFTWDAILGATSYNLQVSTSATFTGLLAINRTVSTPLYTHTLNLAANTTYYWRVRANGAYGPGFWQSPVFSFTTGP